MEQIGKNLHALVFSCARFEGRGSVYSVFLKNIEELHSHAM